MGSKASLEKFPEKFPLFALKHNPVYFVPLLGQDVILLLLLLLFSVRPAEYNILVRSSFTQVSLFALWPPHLIPGGVGCFLASQWLQMAGCHYCAKKAGHIFFVLFSDSPKVFLFLRGKPGPDWVQLFQLATFVYLNL